MARFTEPTEAQVAGYRRWVESRPAHVRAVAERFEPWSLYRLKTTGQRVTVRSFGEMVDMGAGSVTLNVIVSADFNLTAFEREVFGINPDDLEPCELPGDNEPTGALLTQDEVMDNLPALRAMASQARKH